MTVVNFPTVGIQEQDWGTVTCAAVILPLIVVSAIFCLIEHFNCFRSYKLQPTKSYKTTIWSAMFWSGLNLSIICILGLFADPVLRMLFTSGPIPSRFTWTWQLTSFFISEDICFYFYHRMFHVYPQLYYYHKIHHTFKAPFALSSYAVHPIELTCQGLGSVLLPIILRAHIVIWWVYLILRTLQGILDHLGYEFFPFLSTTTYHDLHHSINTGNYASTFHFIDVLFGTDIKRKTN